MVKLKKLKNVIVIIISGFIATIAYIFSSNLNIEVKKLNENEKETIISGFKRAYGLAVRDDTVYIPDFIAGIIYELNLQKKKTRILTRKDNRLKFLSKFDIIKRKFNSKKSIVKPHDIYIDDQSYLYISEMGIGYNKGEGKISVFDKNYTFIKELGRDIHNNFGLISPVMIHKHNNIFYVSEWAANKILRFNNNFEFIDWIGEVDEMNDLIKGNSWSLKKHFIKINLIKPHAVKVGPNNNIYIVDTGNHRILRFGHDGEFKGWIGKYKDGKINNNWSKEGVPTKGDELGAFDGALDLVINDGFIYITEVHNNRIVKFDLDGNSYGWIGIDANNDKFIWTKDSSKKLDLNSPYGLNIKGNAVYVANKGNYTINIIHSNNLFAN